MRGIRKNEFKNVNESKNVFWGHNKRENNFWGEISFLGATREVKILIKRIIK